jgi:hypothetical protein
MRILPTSGFSYNDTAAFRVDSEGFIIHQMYTMDRSDFLKSNPSLQVVLSDTTSKVFLNTVYSWNYLDFKDQQFDRSHTDPINHYTYDAITAYRNVSKMKIYIPYSH